MGSPLTIKEKKLLNQTKISLDQFYYILKETASL